MGFVWVSAGLLLNAALIEHMGFILSCALTYLLAVQGQRLVKQGRALDTPEQNLAELTAQAAELAEKRLPILKALQLA